MAFFQNGGHLELEVKLKSSSSSSLSSSFICHFVVYILQKDKIELMEARSPQETNRLSVKGTPH